MFICDRATGAQRFRGLVRNEIHRRRPRRTNLSFHSVSGMIAYHRIHLGHVGKKETLPILQIVPVHPRRSGYLRFRVFISRQNLEQSGNCKIPDRLGFSRHEN